jgi:hypothetical protein
MDFLNKLKELEKPIKPKLPERPGQPKGSKCVVASLKRTEIELQAYAKQKEKYDEEMKKCNTIIATYDKDIKEYNELKKKLFQSVGEYGILANHKTSKLAPHMFNVGDTIVIADPCYGTDLVNKHGKHGFVLKAQSGQWCVYISGSEMIAYHIDYKDVPIDYRDVEYIGEGDVDTGTISIMDEKVVRSEFYKKFYDELESTGRDVSREFYGDMCFPFGCIASTGGDGSANVHVVEKNGNVICVIVKLIYMNDQKVTVACDITEKYMKDCSKKEETSSDDDDDDQDLNDGDDKEDDNEEVEKPSAGSPNTVVKKSEK